MQKFLKFGAMLGWASLVMLGCTRTEPGDELDVFDEEDVIVAPEGTALRFDPDAVFSGSGSFFDLPFPDDARTQDGFDGVFSAWPGAQGSTLLRRWFGAADDLLEGWGLNSAVFAYFDGPLDPQTIPTRPEQSVDFDNGAPAVFLVDVDEQSQYHGQVLPVSCQFRADAGSFHEANQLGCLSPFGVVRRPNTRYALVVTDRVRDLDGDPVVADLAMAHLLAGRDWPTEQGTIAAAPYQVALQAVEELGVTSEEVTSLILFTTMDPSARLRRINAWYRELPTPQIDEDRGLTVVESYEDFVVLRGYYDVPVIQEGNRPYTQPPEGRILFDENGDPVLKETQSIRFYLTVPRQAMAQEGYPVLLYLHGSGGVAEELLNRGARPDPQTPAPQGSGPGGVVAPYGVAGFAADFNLHGMRHTPRDTTGLMLYNLLGNPAAAIENFIIAANEVTLHARLLEALEFDVAQVEGLSELLDESVTTVRFDSSRFSAMGQSMGSTIGLPALTVDERIGAGIFSGSGGVLIEVALRSMRPINVGETLKATLGYGSEEELDRFDPILSAVQHVWDLVDPVAHARFLFQEPHEGVPPKHALQHSGLEDGYFSAESRAAFSTALGAELVEPVLEEAAFEQMEWVGLGEALTLPVQSNRFGVTAVVTQYIPSVLDGHNVAFQLDEAKAQYACFARSLSADEAPVLRSVEESSVENCP